jgi:hypothetical protein
MVAEKVRMPHSLVQYLNGDTNPLSPYNNGYDYYVYGNLPLAIVRFVAELTHKTSYDNIFIVGRLLSGAADIVAIIGAFFLGALLINPYAGLFAALLLAASVQNIQLCRFMGTENFVGAFVTWSAVMLCYAYRAFLEGRFIRARFTLAGSAALLGFGIASKISALFFLPVALVAICVALFFPGGDYIAQKKSRRVWFELFITSALMFGIVTLLCFRIGQPSAFSGLSFLPSPKFLDNMHRIKELTDGGEWPPNVQWAGRTPIIFPLSQMMQWEMGYGFFFLMCSGLFLAITHSIQKRSRRLLLVIGWVLFFFLYQSTRFVAFGRYLSIVYPFFAVLGGYAIWHCYQQRSVLVRSFATICLILTLCWTGAFNTIYLHDHARVQASRWIYANIAQGSVLLNEAWDDGLPLRVDGKDGFGGLYKEVQCNFYELDTDKKRNEILDKLDQVQYIMLSSNRQFASIPRLETRYTFTSRYYELLFAGKLGFSLVHTTVVAPALFGITIPDKNAVESFTVYDHPAVYIFKKEDTYSRQSTEALLNDFPNGTFEPLTTITAKEISWLP